MNIQQIAAHSPLSLLGLLGLILFASPVAAQVNGVGPSDSALFDFVVNLPPDPDIGDDSGLGGTGFTTQLNISDGGSVGEDFDARSGCEVNISGGSIGPRLNARSGSEVNISGGSLGPGFRMSTRSVQLIGGDFELNGTPFSGDTISFNNSDVFTGTLADGSAFIFFQDGFGPLSDRFSDVQLTSVVLPSLDLTPIVVSTSNPNRPSGLRPGQTLTLQGGGQLGENFEAVSATLIVEGGTLGDFAGAANGEVNISSGSVGEDFSAYLGSEVNISGGNVGSDFTAFQDSVVNISGGSVGTSFGASNSVVNISGGSVDGNVDVFRSEVNISGGSVGFNFDILSGSVVNISGGTVGEIDAGAGSEVNISGGILVCNSSAFRDSVVNISGGAVSFRFSAFEDSEVTISGGSVGQIFSARRGSDVELIGGEFQLNGTPFSDSTISLSSDDIFTGTLKDGSTFIFSEAHGDELSNVTLTLAALPIPDLSPVVVSTAAPNLPSGLRAGQTLTLRNSGELGMNFETVDATLNVEGGALGFGASALRSEVNISGGAVANSFVALSGSVVNISGGSVGAYFDAGSGSVVNISGGSFSDGFIVGNGSAFEAFDGSQVNLLGSGFVLDGNSLDDSLAMDQPFTIVQRGVTLSCLLADGTAFSIDLNSELGDFADGVDPNATLTVTLVSPVPVLGDCNLSGVTDFLDIGPFITLLSTSSFLDEADCNRDGAVDFLDISPFIAILITPAM